MPPSPTSADYYEIERDLMTAYAEIERLRELNAELLVALDRAHAAIAAAEDRDDTRRA
jgi:hypothetical protein